MAQLLNNLSIGAKIKFGKYSVNGETAEPIIWLVVAKNHISTPAYPTNSITLLTEKIIDIRCFDEKEPTNTNSSRVSKGNNNYRLSNIDQWLNSSGNGGAWYSAQHTYDNAPTGTDYGTPYADRPGFLNAFTAQERNAILTTTIRVTRPSVDGGGYDDISRKVFLASAAETGITTSNEVVDGTTWGYFANNSRVASLTRQAFDRSPCLYKPSSITSGRNWWLRTPMAMFDGNTFTINSVGDGIHDNPRIGMYGVRPALNLSTSVRISDTTDSEGCYTIISNVAPTAPSGINVPTVYGGKTTSISWSKSTDADGDAVTYQLECSINGGAYAQIYSGTALSYAHLVPFGTSTVSYRVKATDTSGESSAYKTSATLTVVNNNAPVISGSDTNLGVKSEGFTGTYTVTDANNNTVTVTESIDGVRIRSLVATLGQTITYGVTETTWLALPNGSHTLTISATDGIDTAVRTIVFTKLVDSFSIRNSTPWVSSTMPSRIMVLVTRNIPSAATFKVEVCNNGYDASPTWEDATDAVMSGLVHVFANTTKTATNWGVLVRVTVERNGSTGACYISAIGGNFE